MPKACEFLTANWIDKTRPLPDKEQKRKDKEIPSLYLRIRKASDGGAKSWTLYYTDKETRRRKSYVLEGIPATSKCWGIAKEKAREALESIHLHNKTPKEILAEQIEKQRQEEAINRIRNYKIKDLVPLYAPFVNNLRGGTERLCDLRKLGKSVLGRKPVSQLTSMDIIQFIDMESSSGNKKRTINKKITELYGMVNKLHKHGVVSSEYVFLPPKPEKLSETDSRFDRRYLQEWERKALVENSKNMKPDWLHPAIVISLNTGIRPNSLFHLEWRDINWVNRTLFLRAAHMKTKDNWTIPLNNKAYNAFADWQNRHFQSNPEDLVFPNRLGNPVAKQYWNKYFKKLLQVSCMDTSLGWYNMRHDFASQLVMQGVSLYIVRDLMCHKSITTTHMYAHLAPDNKSSSVQLLDNI